MSHRTAASVGFLLFIGVLAFADWNLGRWGSPAIRRRPRPGGRLTVVFLSVCVACGLMEALASHLFASAAGLALFILALQFPVAAGVALGADRMLPLTADEETQQR